MVFISLNLAFSVCLFVCLLLFYFKAWCLQVAQTSLSCQLLGVTSMGHCARLNLSFSDACYSCTYMRENQDWNLCFELLVCLFTPLCAVEQASWECFWNNQEREIPLGQAPKLTLQVKKAWFCFLFLLLFFPILGLGILAHVSDFVIPESLP